MKRLFLKDPLIVSGVFLPLVLVVLFILASYIPKKIVSPPQYKLLFTEERYDRNLTHQYRFTVENNNLIAEARNTPSQHYGSSSALYHYDVQTSTVKEISLPTPSKLSDKWRKIEVPEIAHFSIDKAFISPDGYEFILYPHNGAGEIARLFFSRSNRAKAVIRKQGNTIPIEQNNRYMSTYGVKFIGWIIHDR